MTLKKSLLLLVPIIALARIFLFSPEKPVRDADAYFCNSCGVCTTIECCCGSNYTSCGATCDRCGTGACCSTYTASWAACSATALTQYCPACGDCCTQSCTPANSYKACCSTSTTNATIAGTYPPTSGVTIYGAIANTITVTGTVTVASGQTFNFNTLSITTGTVSVQAGGLAKYSTACN